MSLLQRILLVLALIWIGGDVHSQALEPRRWSHLPSDVNFFGVGTGYTAGEILFDPAVEIEDATVDLAFLGASYIRTFDLYGKSARIDVGVPYLGGKWEGLLNGVNSSLRRRGLGDAQLRLRLNLYGAPALKGEEFLRYRAENLVNTTVGAALAFMAPTGEYSSDRLINLGNNRWVMGPQLGVLHQRDKWQFEVTGSVIIYGDNDDFWQGTTRKQDPMWFVQGHIIYTFRPGLWASFSTGYGHGGRSRVNGVALSDDSRLSYWAISLGVPINPRQGLNIAYRAKQTNTFTDDSQDGIAIGWSVMFGH